MCFNKNIQLLLIMSFFCAKDIALNQKWQIFNRKTQFVVNNLNKKNKYMQVRCRVARFCNSVETRKQEKKKRRNETNLTFHDINIYDQDKTHYHFIAFFLFNRVVSMLVRVHSLVCCCFSVRIVRAQDKWSVDDVAENDESIDSRDIYSLLSHSTNQT